MNSTLIKLGRRLDMQAPADASRIEIAGWWITAVATFVFPAVFLLEGNLRNLIGLVPVFAGLALIVRGGAWQKLSRDERRMVWIFLAFVAVALVSWLIHGMTDEGWRKVGRVGRFALLFPALAAFIWLRPSARFVFASLTLGGLVVGGGAFWEFLTAAEPGYRVGGDAHVMNFGGWSAALAVALFCGVFLAGWRRHWWVAAAMLLALAGWMLASGLAGVRGAWLGVLPAAVFLAVLGSRHFGWLRCGVAAAAGVLALGLVATTTAIGDRFLRVADEARDYWRSDVIMAPAAAAQQGRCIDDIGALLHYAGAINAPAGEVGLVEGAGLHDAVAPDICHLDAAIRLSAGDRATTFLLPLRAINAFAEDRSARLWVRGRASLALSNRDEPPVDTAGGGWTEVLLYDDSRLGHSRVQVRLDRGESVDLLPLEGWRGELHYFHAVPSVPQRLAMWRIAWAKFLERPLLGQGIGSFSDRLVTLAGHGEAPPGMVRQKHPHGEFLYGLYSRGIPGLLLALLVFLWPAWMFWRFARRGAPGVVAIGAAGFTMVCMIAAYGLTQGLFDHNIMVISYALFVALFAVAARVEEQDRKVAGPPQAA
jgi:O-antigen ligase